MAVHGDHTICGQTNCSSIEDDMNLLRAWCEWDIGVEGVVYTSEEVAHLDLAEALANCGVEEPFEELLEQGLVGLEPVMVIGELPRYQMVGDDDGHEYAIPVDKSTEWYAWMDSAAALDGDAPPTWAIRVEGNLTFTDPKD